ncbi:quinone oxidoreductase [Micrococcales bacterium 31B]|nr:quinone oxidoreductase [Micrococcales bacterium 31B]
MKAIRIETTGDASVLQVDDIEAPTPGPGEALVHVTYAGVNFIDTYHRAGVYPLPLPLTLGLEGTGTVVASGGGAPDDKRFVSGARVAWAMSPGSYAEYVVVPTAKLVSVPTFIDDQTAAAMPLQGMTAHFLVNDSYRVQSGDTLLVHAAAGGVGQLLTQLATAKGARVIATVSTDEKAAIARANGASDIIRYDREDIVDAVKQFTDGAGVAAVYDGVGQATFDASLASLRRRGTLVIFGGASGQVPPFDVQRLNAGGSLTITRPSLGDFIASREELKARSNDIFEQVALQKLDFNVGSVFDLAEAAEAHRALEGRLTTGKVLLRI